MSPARDALLNSPPEVWDFRRAANRMPSSDKKQVLSFGFLIRDICLFSGAASIVRIFAPCNSLRISGSLQFPKFKTIEVFPHSHMPPLQTTPQQLALSAPMPGAHQRTAEKRPATSAHWFLITPNR